MKKYTLLYLLEFFDYDTMKIDRWNNTTVNQRPNAGPRECFMGVLGL